MAYYLPDISRAEDYYPFGLTMPGRSFSDRPYFGAGFNGELTFDQLYGEDGSAYDYGMRIYDAKVGRFMSVDPLTKKYPNFTPYQYAGNTPIQAVDLDGGEPIRPKSLVYNKKDLGFFNRAISNNAWSYYVYVPAESSDGSPTVISVADSYGVEWHYNKLWGMSTEIFVHSEDMTWVEYKGTFYNMTDFDNKSISEKDFQNRQTWEQYWESRQSMQGGLNEISDKASMAVAAGQIVGGIAATAKAIRIGRLYNTSVENKLTKYLLNAEHTSGASKAKWFKEALGFTLDNWKDLAKQIVFDAKTAVSKGNTKGFGEMFEQMIEVTGANGRKINVQFNFIRKEGEDFVRLVGAILTKK